MLGIVEGTEDPKEEGIYKGKVTLISYEYFSHIELSW